MLMSSRNRFIGVEVGWQQIVLASSRHWWKHDLQRAQMYVVEELDEVEVPASRKAVEERIL